jgi:hypothetical protein
MGIAKIKSVLMVAAVFVHAVAFAFYAQFEIDDRGDRRLCASGGGLLAKEVSIGLKLVDDEGYSICRSIRCQIHYWDKKNERWNWFDGKYITHHTDSEKKHADKVGKRLNSLLRKFIKSECDGCTVESFIDSYLKGDFCNNLDENFPEYVREWLEKEGWKDECDIGDDIAIEVVAEGVLRDELDSLISSGE